MVAYDVANTRRKERLLLSLDLQIDQCIIAVRGFCKMQELTHQRCPGRGNVANGTCHQMISCVSCVKNARMPRVYWWMGLCGPVPSADYNVTSTVPCVTPTTSRGASTPKDHSITRRLTSTSCSQIGISNPDYTHSSH